MGDDTLYSGTVAAATEGYLLGIPSIAVSLVGKEFRALRRGRAGGARPCERLARSPFGAPVLLNVNVPDVPYESIAGVEVTRLGRRHKAQPVVEGKNPRGETVYWVGPAGAAREAGPGTDFNALERGRRIGHAAAGGPHARAARSRWCPSWIAPMSARDGIGMTSERTRLRMIEVLRKRGHRQRARARRDGRDPAPPVRRRGHRLARLRGRGAADRPRADDLQPLHRRAHDRSSCSRSSRWARCSRSAPDAATRPRCSRRLVKEVYTLERIAPLMDKARRHLRDLRFYNVRYKHADGHAGYPEGAPYDGILMAASATHVPEALKQQLAVGGRMVLPVGTDDQWLYVIDRNENGFTEQQLRRGALRSARAGTRDEPSPRLRAGACARRVCAAHRPAPVSSERSPPPGRPARRGRPGARAARPQKPVPTHTVKKGDTLVSIALQYGLDYRELAAWNDIANPNRIERGPGAGARRARGAMAATPLPVAARRSPRRSRRRGPPDRGAPAREHRQLKVEPRATKVPFSGSARSRRCAAPDAGGSPVPRRHPRPRRPPAPTPAAGTRRRSRARPRASPAPARPSPRNAGHGQGRHRLDVAREGQGAGALHRGEQGHGHRGQEGRARARRGRRTRRLRRRGPARLRQARDHQHNNTWLSAYAHNDNILVKEQQDVRRARRSRRWARPTRTR